MICDKCNHKLLEDSEFCQYCGNKIEVKQSEPEKVVDEQINQSVEDLSKADDNTPDLENLDLDNMTHDEVLQALIQSHAKDTADIMKENEKSQPNHENEADFGLVPQKPIFTFAMDSVGGEHEYLKKLLTATGEKITWHRRCSMSVDEINGMIDVYDTYLMSGEKYKTLYINMYGARTSSQPPAGFVFNDTTSTKVYKQPKKVKLTKTKYCSRCGALIDNETKKCISCNKQYFKGIKINKYSIAVIALLLAIIISIIINIVQYSRINYLSQRERNLDSQLSDLKSQVSYLNGKINNLNNDISDLRMKNLKAGWDLYFYEQYAVVANEDSKKYHKYGCEDFDESSFLIYNIDAAEGMGYYACPKCND